MRRIATDRPATEVVVVRVIMFWLVIPSGSRVSRAQFGARRGIAAVIPLLDGSVSGAGAVFVISWPGASGSGVFCSTDETPRRADPRIMPEIADSVKCPVRDGWIGGRHRVGTGHCQRPY
jgi:hypothetical protein